MKCVTGVGLFVFICCAPQLGLAQRAFVVLSGTVSGPNGSPVSGARIMVKNTATSETAEAQSDSSGRYSFPNLPPGTYEVTATAEGFSDQATQCVDYDWSCASRGHRAGRNH